MFKNILDIAEQRGLVSRLPDANSYLNGPVRPETFSRQSSFIDPQSYLVANTSEQFPETPGGLPPTQTQSAVQSVGNSTSNLVGDLEAGTVDLESGSALTGVFRAA